MKDVIVLGIGEPDFDTPWHVRESTVFALERGATHYTATSAISNCAGHSRNTSARILARNTSRERSPRNRGRERALDLRCVR